MSYPHIDDGLLQVFDNKDLIYLDERDGGCSIVVRLAPTTINGTAYPLRFEKRSRVINGYIDNQVGHEENVFKAIKEQEQNSIYIKKIVNRIEYIQRGNDYVIVTKDTGVDANKWTGIPLFCKNNHTYYQNIFCHPLVLLHFIKGTLLAFKNIHQVGLFHCDIKEDQICIPFIKHSKTIIPNLNEISLIDFGIAIWKMTPVASRNPIRFSSGNMQKGGYVAEVLINAGDYQKKHYQQHQEYNFSEIFKQIDCGVDLYAFGFLLENLAIRQYPEDKEVWQSFENSYQKWIYELLALSNKKMPFKNNLPHDKYIKQIDQWISGANRILGYTIDDIRFEIKEQSVRATPKYEPTPTPPSDDLPIDHKNENQDKAKKFLEPQHKNTDTKKTKSSLKNAIMATFVIIVVVLGVLIMTINNKSVEPIDQSHTVVENNKYDTADNPSEDLVLAKKNGKYGFIDKSGRTVIGFEYDKAGSFYEGLARVEKNDKYGFIDKTGRTVIGFEYDDAFYFSEGLDSVKKNGKWGFIDKSGRTAIEFEYNYAGKFSEGLALVEKNDKYGFIDKSGRTVIGFEYDGADNFSEGLALVKKNGKWGFIDKSGRMITGFGYDWADNFSEGLALVKKNGKWGYIDKSGRMITGFGYDWAESFYEGLALVKKNDKWGFIDKSGRMITGFGYDWAESFYEGLALVEKNDKYGFIDKSGRTVIPFEYDYAESFYEGLARVRKDGERFCIDKTGERTPCS